jgi:hypothetical protein
MVVAEGTYLVDGFPRNLENLNTWQTQMGGNSNLVGIINIIVSQVRFIGYARAN